MTKSNIDLTFTLPAILIVAFLLRYVGISFGLPFLYHADEPIVVNHALAYGTGDLNPHFFKIPPLLSYLLFFVYGIVFCAGKLLGKWSSPADFEILFYQDPTIFFFLGRLLFGVIVGTFSVWVLFQLVKSHFDKNRALLSAFFLAISFSHVKNSHYLYADIPLILVLILAFDEILELANNDSKWQHIKVGILIGLASAIKYNGVFMVIPYVVSVLFNRPLRQTVKPFFAAILGSLATLMLLNPFAILDFPQFISELAQQSKSHGSSGILHHLLYSLGNGMGGPLLLFSLVGLINLFLSFEKKRFLMALFILFYYLVISFKGQRYDRYVLPLIPFLCFFAADAFVVIKSQLKKSKTFTITLLFVVAIFSSIYSSVRYDLIMSTQDTRTLAKEWIENNIPFGSRLALDSSFFMPRLFFDPEQLENKKQQLLKGDPHSDAKLRKLHYLLDPSNQEKPHYKLHFMHYDLEDESTLYASPKAAYDLAALKASGIQYVVIAVLQKNRKPADFFSILKAQGKLIQTISPYGNTGKEFAFDEIPMTGGPFLIKELIIRNRPGPTLQIYEI